MSIPSKSPLVMVGGILNSGIPRTGEVLFTTGGGKSASVYSGLVSGNVATAIGPDVIAGLNQGSDVVIHSGAGRFNRLLPLIGVQSGASVLLYDQGSSPATSGGPFPASGHKLIGVLPAGNLVATPLVSGGLTPTLPISYDLTYTGGLCAAVRSGCGAFAVSYTPETNPNYA